MKIYSGPRIKSLLPIAELDGDEMARVIWSLIKKNLISPFLNLKIDYYDLGLPERDKTNDEVTLKAGEAIKKHKVGVKCATITPDAARVREFNLRRCYPSPNGTIRNQLNGSIFREPIVFPSIPRLIPGWNKPIIIARHSFADQYKAVDILIDGPTSVVLSANQKNHQVYNFKQSQRGVALAMFNTEDSIREFAKNCFRFAILRKVPMFFSTKNTVLRNYDGLFKDVFEDIFRKEGFEGEFKKLGISYEHRLIDDMVAQMVKSSGGFLWALKNYDGDVMSDLVAQGFGSLGLMSSILLSSEVFFSEAAHGTVTRHFRLHQKNQETSTNSIASIYAWTKALGRLAELEQNANLGDFVKIVEESVGDCVAEGKVTKDLAMIRLGRSELQKGEYMTTEGFIDEVRKKVAARVTIQGD